MKTIRFSRYTDEMLDDIALTIANTKRNSEALCSLARDLFKDIGELGLRLDKLENKRKVK